MDIVKKIAQEIDIHLEHEYSSLPFSPGLGYNPIPLSASNFHEISLFSGEKPLYAIDGGSAPLLSSSSFAVCLIRMACVGFLGRKRFLTSRKECYSIVQARQKDNSLFFEASFTGDPLFSGSVFIPCPLQTLEKQHLRIEIDSVIDILRRYAELLFAANIMQEQRQSCFVIDGSIEVQTEDEKGIMAELFASARKGQNSLGFLSKTSHFLTKDGGSFLSRLHQAGPKSSWYYYPTYDIRKESYPGYLYFVRLHMKSPYIFSLGLMDEAGADDFMHSLVQHAQDPVFLGYPYPLVQADREARISRKEQEYHRTLLVSRIKQKDKLRYALSSLDAHDVLDSISF